MFEHRKLIFQKHNYQIINKKGPLFIKRSSWIPLESHVRKKGLEPPRLAAPDPKSGAATNYATSAYIGFL